MRDVFDSLVRSGGVRELPVPATAALGQLSVRDQRQAAQAADGALLATSPKLHLYDAFGAQESRWVEPDLGLASPKKFLF